jgi:hypothetical protein
LVPDELSVNLTIRNLSESIGYTSVRFKAEYYMTETTSKRVASETWMGGAVVGLILPGARLEVEEIEREGARFPLAPGVYAVTRGKFEVTEATAFIRVPDQPGTESPDGKGRLAVGSDHRYTIVRRPAEGVTELTLGSPWRR